MKVINLKRLVSKQFLRSRSSGLNPLTRFIGSVGSFYLDRSFLSGYSLIPMAPHLDQHNYHQIDATIIADSLTDRGHRITSMVCTFPRIILSEFNTHRLLSRNSASSRAIPVRRMIEDVRQDPFIPIRWMKAHRGMQGYRYFTEEDRLETSNPTQLTEDDQLEVTDPTQGTQGTQGTQTIKELERLWLEGRDQSLKVAQQMADLKTSKQIINRLLEPYKWHTVIVTATEWDNFFALRAEKEAEIHIQDLAYKMLKAYNESQPRLLQPGQWHIPFGDRITWDPKGQTSNDLFLQELVDARSSNQSLEEALTQIRIKIATARCARVSYENFEGRNDYHRDLGLHDQLAESGHWSPFEHCARAMTDQEYRSSIRGHLSEDYTVKIADQGWSGNFQGFVQYRKMFSSENREDPRVKRLTR